MTGPPFVGDEDRSFTPGDQAEIPVPMAKYLVEHGLASYET